MTQANAALLGSVLFFVSALIGIYFNRRGTRADTLSKLDAVIDKVQERADKLYDEKVACEIEKDKLRNDLAIALVQTADQQKEIANLKGYIQGLTDPLIKLEQAQKAALAGGRRETDKK